MAVLADHASEISAVGAAMARTGEQVHATWQALTAVYEAPEAGQLLAAIGPVRSISASVGEDLESAGAALASYAAEVREIQARLDSLRAQALTLEASVDSGGDWNDDSEAVERNNELVRAVDTAVADFDAAQRRCASVINALHGGQLYRVDDGDGRQERGEYGHTTGQLDATAGNGQGLPWGQTAAEGSGLFSSIGHGILDAAGLVPVIGEPADGLNAVWYAAEGDALNASLSAAGMVPILGWGATGAKAGIKGAKAVEGAEETARAGQRLARDGGLPPVRQFVTTPRGTTFDVPQGWESRPASNGKGIVFQRPGAAGDADSMRIMEPTPRYPNGYYRYYNGRGQPLDINGKPGSPGATHIPEQYVGQIKGWPK